MPVKPETEKRFLALIARLDDKQRATLLALMEVCEDQRDYEPVVQIIRRLGTRPLSSSQN